MTQGVDGGWLPNASRWVCSQGWCGKQSSSCSLKNRWRTTTECAGGNPTRAMTTTSRIAQRCARPRCSWQLEAFTKLLEAFEECADRHALHTRQMALLSAANKL